LLGGRSDPKKPSLVCHMQIFHKLQAQVLVKCLTFPHGEHVEEAAGMFVFIERKRAMFWANSINLDRNHLTEIFTTSIHFRGDNA